MKYFIETINKQKLEGLTLVILTYLMSMGVFIGSIKNMLVAVKYAGIAGTIVVVCIWTLNKVQVLNLTKINSLFRIAYFIYLIYVICLLLIKI